MFWFWITRIFGGIPPFSCAPLLGRILTVGRTFIADEEFVEVLRTLAEVLRLLRTFAELLRTFAEDREEETRSRMLPMIWLLVRREVEHSIGSGLLSSPQISTTSSPSLSCLT